MKKLSIESKRFFGLHFDLHPRKDDTELGADITEEMIKSLLLEVKPDYVQYDCKGHPGYTGYPTKVGWSSPGIKKDSLAIWRSVTKKYGVELYVHYSGAWDEVAAEKYPEWTVVNADGTQDKKILSFFSPYVDKIMIPQLKELIELYDIDGAWVDGDSWAVKPDWSQRAINEFKRAYRIDKVPHKPEDPYWKEWMEFQRRKYLEYVEKYVTAVHAFKKGFKITVNWLYSTYSPIPVNISIDFLSGDVIPQSAIERFRIESRYLASKDKVWDLMTWGFILEKNRARIFKPVIQMMQEAAIVISQGGGFSVYYNPTRSGWIDKWMIRSLARISEFCRARKEFSYRTETIRQIAILLSTAEHFKRLDKEGRIFGIANSFHDSIMGMLDALLELHYSVDILDDYNIDRMLSYPLIVIPEWEVIKEETIKKLISYIERGGNLVISGAKTALLFKKYLGVKFLNGPKVEKEVYIPSGDVLGWIGGAWLNVKEEKSECLGLKFYTTDLRKKGRCAATLNKIGKGYVLAFYGPLGKVYYNYHIPAIREFLGNIISRIFNPIVSLDAPPYIDIVLRKRGDKLLIHLINLARRQTSINYSLIDNIPSVGPIQLKVNIKNKPKSIYTIPENEELAYKFKGDKVYLTIPKMGIHSIIVLERALN